MARTGLKAGAEQVLSRIYASLLQECANGRDIARGKHIHRHWLASGLKPDLSLDNHLLTMYTKCGSVDNARQVFDQMLKRNVVSWTLIISAFGDKGRFDMALRYFTTMLLHGALPNKVTLITILKACAAAAAARLHCFALGLVHACAAESGLDSDVAVATALVNAYGGYEHARRVFEKVGEPDLILWNAVIAAHAGNSREMILMFRKMQLEGVHPDAVTFSTVVTSCDTPAALEQGKIIHKTILESGCQSDLVVANALVDMYRKCGSLDDAMDMFSRMERIDLITWNVMIAACVEQQCFDDALQLYRQMQAEGVLPDKLTISSLLNACAADMDIAEGQKIHDRVLKLGIQSDAMVGTGLVNMYGKCGNLEAARKTFDSLLHRDVATWTVYMAAYVDAGEKEACLMLFRRMQLEGVLPNKVTFLVVLSGCSTLEEAKLVYSFAAAAGLAADVSICNTIINVYGNCGGVEDAEGMFAKIYGMDVFSWNALLKVYADAGRADFVLQLYLRMQLEGVVPDKVTLITALNSCNSKQIGRLLHRHVVEAGYVSNGIVENALVSMLVKCGSLEEACQMFDTMKTKSVVSWTLMIDAFTEANNCRKALYLFQRMQAEGVKPNTVTLTTIVNWSARLRDMASFKLVQMCVEESGMELNGPVANALLNLLGKFGRLKQAHSLFNRMVERDTLSWNLMISSHAQHGYAKESLLLLDRMKQDGMKPDDVTFVNILAACSHRGLVEQGCEQFGYLSREYGIEATSVHCGCMVDLLGRVGRISEAREFICKSGLDSSVSAWTSLLGACRAHDNVSEGKIAADKLLKLDPRNSTAYINLSNLFSGNQRQHCTKD